MTQELKDERAAWLDDMRRAIRSYAHACQHDKAHVADRSAEIERLLSRATQPPAAEGAGSIDRKLIAHLARRHCVPFTEKVMGTAALHESIFALCLDIAARASRVTAEDAGGDGTVGLTREQRDAIELGIGALQSMPSAAAVLRSLLAATQPSAEAMTDGDVYTLIGHAELLRGNGETDMPAWFMGLAERIATAIGNKALAQRVRGILAAAPAEAKGGNRG